MKYQNLLENFKTVFFPDCYLSEVARIITINKFKYSFVFMLVSLKVSASDVAPFDIVHHSNSKNYMELNFHYPAGETLTVGGLTQAGSKIANFHDSSSSPFSEKCVQKIERSNSRALAQSVAAAPPGCILLIEGVYAVTDHWDLNVILRSVNSGLDYPLTDYGIFQFPVLDRILSGTEDPGYQPMVLTIESGYSMGFPGAVLIPGKDISEH